MSPHTLPPTVVAGPDVSFEEEEVPGLRLHRTALVHTQHSHCSSSSGGGGGGCGRGSCGSLDPRLRPRPADMPEAYGSSVSVKRGKQATKQPNQTKHQATNQPTKIKQTNKQTNNLKGILRGTTPNQPTNQAATPQETNYSCNVCQPGNRGGAGPSPPTSRSTAGGSHGPMHGGAAMCWRRWRLLLLLVLAALLPLVHPAVTDTATACYSLSTFCPHSRSRH